jgi:hypothetical protein
VTSWQCFQLGTFARRSVLFYRFRPGTAFVASNHTSSELEEQNLILSISQPQLTECCEVSEIDTFRRRSGGRSASPEPLKDAGGGNRGAGLFGLA